MDKGEQRSGAPGLGAFAVRAVRADEWTRIRELRLEALRDPVADLAFRETYADAVARPESFWRERAAGAAEGTRERQQFVAEMRDGGNATNTGDTRDAEKGAWVGSLTVLLEEKDATDVFGAVVERRQAHVVGVFVRAEYRGHRAGVTRALFDAGLGWAWASGVERVRLFVHERNERAAALYRKVGFVPTGVTLPGPDTAGGVDREHVLLRP